VLGEVVDVDVEGPPADDRHAGADDDAAYDSLIVATGASQSYFAYDEYARDAPGMKTIEDALELRGRIFGPFEMAELEPDDAAREPWDVRDRRRLRVTARMRARSSSTLNSLVT
jgi:NADH:ubiquinone reductase (H+-translocating)